MQSRWQVKHGGTFVTPFCWRCHCWLQLHRRSRASPSHSERTTTLIATRQITVACIYRCCFVAFSSGFSATAICGVNVKKMDIKILQFFFTSSKRGDLTFLKGNCWMFYQRNYPSIHLSSTPFSPALWSLGLEEPITAVFERGQGTWKSCRVYRRAT